MFGAATEVLTEAGLKMMSGGVEAFLDVAFEPCDAGDVAETPCGDDLKGVGKEVVGCPQIEMGVVGGPFFDGESADVWRTHQRVVTVCSALDFAGTAFLPRRVCVDD